jgi:type II secretory pathway pseudopilin PulG
MQAYKNTCTKLFREAGGFTILEILMVVLLTGILANIFGNMFVNAIKIYSNQNLRKTGLLDQHRAFDMVSRDLREWKSWNTDPADGSTVFNFDFNHYQKYKFTFLIWTYYYYDDIRVAYNLNTTTTKSMTYQRDENGQFASQYTIIAVGQVNTNYTGFIEYIYGCKRLPLFQLNMTVGGTQMISRAFIFPRSQGG